MHYQIESRPTRYDRSPEGVTIMTAKTAEMTTKDFAAAIGTDPKTLRKYLRDNTPKAEQPGKGGRWVLPGTKSALATARRSFAKWQKEQAEKAADRAAKAVKDADEALEDLTDDDAEVEGTDEDSTPSLTPAHPDPMPTREESDSTDEV